MDIEAISGLRVSDVLQPMGGNNEIELVGRVLAPMINDTIRIDWNVRDRVTISAEARRRCEEWRAKSRKREREGQRE